MSRVAMYSYAQKYLKKNKFVIMSLDKKIKQKNVETDINQSIVQLTDCN